ncbi:2,5-diketo-D-gluconate reductase A [Arthrobacter sp. 31Cvi3.1E]|uniref:aldo/keto reductase n=1 Tax=Paenarthrobacter nicotinovorans TaxID=29320 RepID=UPI0009A641A6|nr:2,5-diketo-D-gluconate reductase A [Arthrobacter sp. 31Cvi3.1E]
MTCKGTETTTTEIANGVRVPLIGLGTWPLRGEDAAAAVSQAISNGYRHIDTAENYANESAVGEGIRRSGIARSELFLTTKFNTRWHSRSGVREAFGNSVQQLGTDYLDLFLVHWPNPAQGRYVDACEELQNLVDDGSIRAWGVSNFKPSHLMAVQGAGLAVPLNQVQVDPEHGQPDQLAYHRGHGIVTAAYSPLGRSGGFLSHPAVDGPAKELGKTPAQIVLRWHVQHGRVAVPKSADSQRQQQNLDVFNFRLNQQHMAAIDALETGAAPRLDSDTYFH